MKHFKLHILCLNLFYEEILHSTRISFKQINLSLWKIKNNNNKN